MAVQFAPENFPEIPPWCGGVPPRSTGHGFYDIIAEKTSAQPLHHTKPPRWLVGEEVFYPLEDNAENDLPEIPKEFAETVEVIKQAIDARQLVEIEYFSQKLEKTVRLFAPEIIVIYKIQWYVAGFCKLREERRTFRLDNIEKIIGNQNVEYLIIQHMEPDHSGSIFYFLNKYKDAKIIIGCDAHNLDALSNENVEKTFELIEELGLKVLDKIEIKK